ncbi:MAG TPA: arylsulfatase [Acidobacteriaceae bacterium]|nr:arylsulfatase [Acidobacteriaceae bacterium]
MSPSLGFFPRATSAGVLAFAVAQAALAQTPDRTTLPIAPPPFRGNVTRDYRTSTLEPAEPLTAPKGAPNVLLILLDDAGYGQTATFGGMIPTPTLDSLAQQGLRYTRFHVTALCSPTRSALMTGRNHHAVGMGTITNWANGYPGYTGSIPKSAAFVSEILRENGYATAAFGKWHLIPDAETTLAGPYDHWPTHQGYDHYYGFIGADTDQWHPELTEGTKPIAMVAPPGREKDYTLNEDLATHACAWIEQQKALAPDRPLFIYYATGATHAPLEAPEAWIDKFKGKFDMGWDKYREMVLARQKRLGVVPQDTVLTPRPAELPAWDSLSPDEKKVAERLMEVFAGYMAQADFEIGRVIETLRRTGQLDNTLVFYIAGDNGASLEGNINGTDNLMEQVNGIVPPASEVVKHLDTIGLDGSNPHYPAGWAWAGNTPFQWGKRIGSHLGGTRDPLVVAWAGHIKDPGSVRSQYQDVTDIFPTILEAAGVPQPKSVDGVEQQPVNGISFLASFTNAQAPERETQYFEMHGNRAMYDHGWIAAQRTGLLPWAYTFTNNSGPLPWELYDLDKDYSEANNLAAKYPGKLAQLEKLFDEEAWKNHVYPIDPRIAGRQHPNPPPPGGRAFYTFYPGATHLYDALAPGTRNRTHTFTAYVTIPPGGADGVLVAEGGEAAGYSLYIKDGHPAYTYNYFRMKVTTITSPDKLPEGRSVIELHFAYDGGGLGKGATVTLTVNGKKEGEARLEQTVPRAYSFEETFDVGEDSASPVGPYRSPFSFTGTLEKLELRSGPLPQLSDSQQKVEQKYAERIAALKD